MDVSTPLLAIATAGGLLLLAPAVALFFGGVPTRRNAIWLAGLAIGATAVATAAWMLLGEPASVALFQGAIAAVAALTVAAVGLRVLPSPGLVAGLGVWVVIVVVPIGHSLFAIDAGWLASRIGTLDFGGASVLGIVPATAAVAVALVSRGVAVPSPTTELRRPLAILIACALAGLVAFTLLSVGAQLVVDDTAPVLVRNSLIAAIGGVIGWISAQIANIRRANTAGIVAGVFAGSLAILPASPWLESGAVAVLSIAAGLLGHLVTIAVRTTPYNQWASVIGVCLVPAAVGIVGTGVVAAGAGLLYSGQTELSDAQALGLTIVVAVSFVAALAIAGATRAVASVVRLSASRRLVGR